MVFMVTSVTVEDKLRKKIKRIAAELDTTQGDVIAQAVELLEEKINHKETPKSSKARKIMRDAALKAKSDRKRQKIRDTLIKPGIKIDEVKIVRWGDLDED